MLLYTQEKKKKKKMLFKTTREICVGKKDGYTTPLILQWKEK